MSYLAKAYFSGFQKRTRESLSSIKFDSQRKIYYSVSVDPKMIGHALASPIDLNRQQKREIKKQPLANNWEKSKKMQIVLFDSWIFRLKPIEDR